jgi:predicted transcriptional regulator
MMSAADRIIEATMEHTLRPKRGNREKVIIAILEFIVEEYSYKPLLYFDGEVIDVKNIKDLIEELRDTETLEEPAQGGFQDPS